MSDQNEILDMDLNQVDTNIPLLQAGVHALVVEDSSVEDNAAGDGKNWNLKLATTEPTTGTKGETIEPGHPVYHTCSTTTSTSGPATP